MKALMIFLSIVISVQSLAVEKTSLPNAKMNAVIQISHRVLMARAQHAIMSSADLNCMADMPAYSLSNIRVECDDTYFSRESGNIFFNFEIRVRAQLLNSIPVSTLATAVFRVNADVDEESPNRLTLLLGISFERIDLALAIPELAELTAVMSETIASHVPAPMRVPMNNGLLADVELEGNPELTIVGGSKASSPTIAIGLELSDGDNVDRPHFRSSYSEHLLTDEGDDWSIQVEATIMKKLVKEVSSGFKDDFDEELGSWEHDFALDDFDGYWVREASSVGYKNFDDYVNAHDHPLWFIGKATYTYTQCVSVVLVPIPGVPRKCFDINIGAFGFGYADFEFRGSGADKMVVVDPYFWNIDATNPIYSWAINSRTFNPAAVPVTSAHITQDLEIMRFDFTFSKLTVYGRDNFHSFSGRPTLDVENGISATYLSVKSDLSTATKRCTISSNVGEISNGYVIGRGQICNTGHAPLWICSGSITNDTDLRFRSMVDFSSPTIIDPGDCLSMEIGMKIVPGDNQWHYATFTIRSNDPDRPVVNVNLSGVWSGNSEYSVCLELPFYMNQRTLRQDILDKIEASFKKDLPKITKDFDLPEFTPEPPICPECGYYLEMLLESTANAEVTIKADKNRFAEHGSYGDANFLSLPLKSLSKMQISLTPDTIKGQSRLLLGVKSIENIGTHDVGEKIVSSICLNDCFVLTDKNLKKFQVLEGNKLKEVASLPITQPGELSYRFGKLFVVGESFIATTDPDSFQQFEFNTLEKGKSVVLAKKMIVVYNTDSVSTYSVGTNGLRKLSQAPIQNIVNIAQSDNGFVVVQNSEKTVKAMVVRTLDEGGLARGIVLKQEDAERIQKQLSELNDVKKATFSTEGYLLIPQGETKVTIVKKTDRTNAFSSFLKKTLAATK